MRVNEIFYSLQGEGAFTGVPAVFVRFSGCNCSCDFCDTDHFSFREMSEEDICAAVSDYPTEVVIITGGEPTLQLNESLLRKLHQCGKRVHIETNGSIDVDDGVLDNIDWITVSPKYRKVLIRRIDELKLVFRKGDNPEDTLLEYKDRVGRWNMFLQPCATSSDKTTMENLQATIEYIKSHPRWRLSLQTHKLIDIP